MKPLPERVLLAASLFLSGLISSTAADLTATATSGGNWSDPLRWSTNPLFPSNGNGGLTFDVVQSNHAITLDTAVTIEKFNKSGGILQGSKTLNINDLFTFTAGNAAELNGSVVVNANGGTLITGPTASSELNIYGSSVLNLNSPTSWTAGRINFANSSQVINSAGNTFTTTFDGQFFGVTSGGSFTNNGTFTKSGGTGSTLLGNGNFIAVTNNGTIDSDSGTIRLRNTTNNGILSASAGAAFLIESTSSLNAGSQITGAGTVTQNGTVTVNATVPVSTTYQLIGGVMNGNGTMNLNGQFNVTGGELNGNVTVNANAGTAFSGSGDKAIYGTSDLNLNSSTSWTGGRLVFNAGAVLTNSVGQTFTTTFDGEMFGTTSNGAFVNRGIFNKDSGTGTTMLGNGNAVNVTNDGTINVNSGTIRLRNTLNTGTLNVGTGNGLLLESTINLNTGSQITGNGTTTQNGTVTVNATVPVSTTYNLTGGTLNGNGTLNLNGPVNFTGGETNGNVTVNANGVTTISGTGTKSIFGTSDLFLNNTTTWTAGQINFTTGSTLNNTGTLSTNFDGQMFGVNSGGAFTNSGTFTKNGGTGTTTIGTGNGVPFSNTGVVNADSGTLTFNSSVTQHSGTTLTGGTWNVTNGASINITPGSNITTIGSAASVTLDGAGSSFAKVTTALSSNQGSFTIKNDRDLTTAGAYTNSGTTRVEDSTTVMTIGSGGSAAYTQTGGVTALVNGAFIDPSVFNLNGGTLKGTGTIESSVIAGPGSSTIAPGMSPGTLTINGNLTLSSGSTLAMELGGLSQGTLYDYLDVNGVLTLAGMLDLDFINGFETGLPSGAILTLATANSAILGSFSNVASGSYLMTNFPIGLQVWYGAGSPYGAENLVVAIPEPSRALLMLAGLQALWLRRRRPALASV